MHPAEDNDIGLAVSRLLCQGQRITLKVRDPLDVLVLVVMGQDDGVFF